MLLVSAAGAQCEHGDHHDEDGDGEQNFDGTETRNCRQWRVDVSQWHFCRSSLFPALSTPEFSCNHVVIDTMRRKLTTCWWRREKCKRIKWLRSKGRNDEIEKHKRLKKRKIKSWKCKKSWEKRNFSTIEMQKVGGNYNECEREEGSGGTREHARRRHKQAGKSAAGSRGPVRASQALSPQHTLRGRPVGCLPSGWPPPTAA